MLASDPELTGNESQRKPNVISSCNKAVSLLTCINPKKGSNSKILFRIYESKSMIISDYSEYFLLVSKDQKALWTKTVFFRAEAKMVSCSFSLSNFALFLKNATQKVFGKELLTSLCTMSICKFNYSPFRF